MVVGGEKEENQNLRICQPHHATEEKKKKDVLVRKEQKGISEATWLGA